ncbi:MAG: DEAD/DEAH box helicase [Phycisphaeraceae bacterium]
MTFQSMGLSDAVLKGVTDAGFEMPTHIQAKLIPAILAGRDVIGQAKTGTGKTAAFGLPILHLVDPAVPVQALILVPTRELAAQVAGEMEELGKGTPIRATCVIGGESMREQSRSLRGGTQIIVGTPGRVMDMQGRGELRFDHVRFVVLDEVDRMLDIGFREDIRRILGTIKSPHQTIFVSATVSPDIETLARRFMRPDAEKIVSVTGALTVSLVDQKYLPVEPWDKPALLEHLLKHEAPDTTLIFCRTKNTVHRVAKRLNSRGFDAKEIHGDLAQAKRNKVMESMRDGKLSVLVASDLAARGLDVEHISHVINYDLPEDPEVYIHRIGRTARAGKKGTAWAFVSSDQGQLLTEIEKLAGIEIQKMEYPDFQPGPPPADIAELRAREAKRRAIASKDPVQALAERSAPATAPTDEMSPEEMARRFPGGIVPKGPPPGGLGRHFRSRRGR